MRGRQKFARWKPLIGLIIKIVNLLFPLRFKIWLFYRLRMVQGSFGLGLRYILLKSSAKNCGDNVSIHPAVYLLGINNISIGNNVSIHPFSYLDATGGIEIGNDVSIAHGTTIMSTTHTFNDENMPTKDQIVEHGNVTIENNVWIGAKATILAGISIKEGSIIGAGSIVTKNVAAYTIVAGNPAKLLKNRMP